MYRIQRGMVCAGITLAIVFSGLAVSFSGSAEETTLVGADLIVSDMSWCDMFGDASSVEPTITSGQPYTITATIENMGTEGAGSFSTVLYIDGITFGSAVALTGLAARGNAAISWAGIVTSDTGRHEAQVAADSENTVDELNPDGTAEENNELTGTFDVVNAGWTFAVYIDGDNNLEYVGFLDFLEMALVGTTPEVNIVVQFDRVEGYYTDYGDWTDAKRFLITRGMEPWAESAYEDLGEVNMGDEETLSDFVLDTFERFRSARTSLVLWDHGSSWYGGCCRDEASANDSLKTDEMRGALMDATGVLGTQIDIVGFDACVMASMEICYAFEDLCVNFVAPEAMVSGTGWPYDAVTQQLVANPSMGSEQLCEVMVSEYIIEYEGSSIDVLSAFRVDVVCSSVRDALSEFADSLPAGGDSYDGRVQSARNVICGFDIILTDPSYKDSYSADLYTFAREVASRIADERVQVAAGTLMSALEDARIAFGVIAEFKPYGDIFGMMIFWPEQPLYLEEYTAERLSLDTTWDEFLLDYYSE